MSELLVCFQRYKDNTPSNLPAEVHYFSQDNGKVFMHLRGRNFRIDRWFASFDEAAVSISKLVDTGYYRMRGSFESIRNPLNVPLFNDKQMPISTVYSVGEIDRELVAL